MNREIVIPGGAGVYPLTGDVQSQAGSPLVKVTGIQGTAITDPLFAGGEYLEYDINTNTWNPTLRATIQLNNITVSDDPLISINVAKPALINGA